MEQETTPTFNSTAQNVCVCLVAVQAMQLPAGHCSGCGPACLLAVCSLCRAGPLEGWTASQGGQLALQDAESSQEDMVHTSRGQEASTGQAGNGSLGSCWLQPGSQALAPPTQQWLTAAKVVALKTPSLGRCSEQMAQGQR